MNYCYRFIITFQWVTDSHIFDSSVLPHQSHTWPTPSSLLYPEAIPLENRMGTEFGPISSFSSIIQRHGFIYSYFQIIMAQVL